MQGLGGVDTDTQDAAGVDTGVARVAACPTALNTWEGNQVGRPRREGALNRAVAVSTGRFRRS